MLTVNKLLPQGRGLAPALLRRATTVSLDWDTRQKSRFDATDTAGRMLGVFLPRGTVVRGGDVLVVEDGSLVRVEALPQPVLVVRTCPSHGAPVDLLRAAYHLGNRHIQLDVRPDRLQLEPDHVLADMLRQMHLIVTEETGAFEPEAGAYAQGGHAHGHEPALAATPASASAHVHGPGCGHGAAEPHGHTHEHLPGHAHSPAQTPVNASGVPAAEHPARKPIAIPIRAADAPHAHGPACDHDH